MSTTRYDFDGNADGYFDDPFMKVREKGKFVLHSDYDALLTRVVRLEEALKTIYAWPRPVFAADAWEMKEVARRALEEK